MAIDIKTEKVLSVKQIHSLTRRQAGLRMDFISSRIQKLSWTSYELYAWEKRLVAKLRREFRLVESQYERRSK